MVASVQLTARQKALEALDTVKDYAGAQLTPKKEHS